MGKELTRSSKIIIADMIKARRPLSVKRIAERNSMTWKTANNNIRTLERRGIVKCDRTTRKTSCQINPVIKKQLSH